MIVIAMMARMVGKRGGLGNPQVLRQQAVRGILIIIFYGLFLLSHAQAWSVMMPIIFLSAIVLTALFFDVVVERNRKKQ